MGQSRMKWTFTALLAIVQLEAATSRTFDCSGGDTYMQCRCSDESTPRDSGSAGFSYRFGYELHIIVKKSEGSNTRTQYLTVSSCRDPIKFHINLENIVESLPQLKQINFEGLGPINVYMVDKVSRSKFTIFFSNIHGFDNANQFSHHAASVVLRGPVSYCDNPCGSGGDAPQSGPPSLKTFCDNCDADSSLNIIFKDVEHVLFDDFSLGTYSSHVNGPVATVSASQVSSFRVTGSYLKNVDLLGVQASECWKNSDKVACRTLSGTEEYDNPDLAAGIGAGVGAFLFISLIVVIVLVVAARKRRMNASANMNAGDKTVAVPLQTRA